MALKIRMKSALLAMIAGCLLPGLAGAVDGPRLKAEAVVTGAIVRFGDLVDQAGDFASTPLFSAPALGGIGTIKAERIAEAARELGLIDFDGRSLASVTVRRPKRTIDAADLRRTMQQALSERDRQFADAPLMLDQPLADLETEAGEPSALTAKIDEIDLRSGRFALRLITPSGSLRISGTADARFDLPVLARALNRGEAITPADVATERRSRRELPAGALTEVRQVVGLVARRALPAGQPLRESDLSAPDLVERNQLVTVSYDMPGMSLSLRGRALAAGALGAVVPVQNGASKRTIEAVVTGNGRVTARLDDKILKSQK